MLLVLMDNATAEYAFISAFFAPPPTPTPVSGAQSPTSTGGGALFSPSEPILLPQDQSIEDIRRPSIGGETVGSPPPIRRTLSLARSISNDLHNSAIVPRNLSKEELANLAALWKQVMEPTLNYCQVCMYVYVCAFSEGCLLPSFFLSFFLFVIFIIQGDM